MSSLQWLLCGIALAFMYWITQYDKGVYDMENCDNCKHEEASLLTEQCEQCQVRITGYTNWEPKEEDQD